MGCMKQCVCPSFAVGPYRNEAAESVFGIQHQNLAPDMVTNGNKMLI